MLGHKPKEVLIQVLKGSRASQDYIEAARHFRCDACAQTARAKHTHPVAAPSSYEFNYELQIDILTIHDINGLRYQFLSIVDCGTVFHVVCLILEGGGTPSSKKCLEAFMDHWVSWAGFPKFVTVDRGTHNRGTFVKTLSANGIYVRPIGLGSPEHLGRGERHGDIFKENVVKVIKDHNISGKLEMKLAAYESISQKNEHVRYGGFSPSQWVLGRAPRGVGRMLDVDELGHLGVLEGQLNGETAFAQRAGFRTRL